MPPPPPPYDRLPGEEDEDECKPCAGGGSRAQPRWSLGQTARPLLEAKTSVGHATSLLRWYLRWQLALATVT